MPLPHPHGTGPGQIGHNSSIDTGDTPGSTGGKFIGWGEEGTSAYANRAHWALSENIDYLNDIIVDDRAVAQEYFWIVPGGGESKKQIADTVFCGDTTYPTSAELGLPLLFAVLDYNYNELQTADGKKVVVYQVFDSTDTFTVYKTGFVSSPWVYFEVEGSPYTIPSGTNVRLIYCGHTSYEDLPTDAMTRYLLRSVGELPAGVLLQDGSRKMTGEFDMDGHDIANIDSLNGQAASTMTVRSYGDLLLKDQYLSSSVPLSQSTDTALRSLSGQNNSLAGMINSNADLHYAYGANRRVTGGGNLVVTDGIAITPSIGLPSGDDYSMNGELLTGSTTPRNTTISDAWAYVYMDSAGDLYDDAVTRTLTSEECVIAVYYYNSGTQTFDTVIDMRAEARQRQHVVEVTVGDRVVGTDFGYISTAIEFFRGLQRMWTAGSRFMPSRFVLRIIGTNGLSGATVDLSDIDDLTIVGDGVDRSQITVDPSSSAQNVFSCGGTCRLSMRDLKIAWGYAADQDPGYAMVESPASYSSFERLAIGMVSHKFAIGFGFQNTATDVTFRDISSTTTEAMVRGANSSGVGTLTSGQVENCQIFSYDIYGVFMPAGVCKVRDTVIWNSGGGGVMIGHAGEVSGCAIVAVGGPGVYVFPYTGYADPELFASIHHNTIMVTGGEVGVGVWNNSSTADIHVDIDGNRILGTYGVSVANDSSVGAQSAVRISNNRFDGCTNAICRLEYARTAHVKDNTIVNHTGTGIWATTGTLLFASGNYFEGFGADGASRPHAVYVDNGALAGPKVTCNWIGNAGDTLPTNAIMVQIEVGDAIVSNNHFIMADGGTHDALKILGATLNVDTGHLINSNVFYRGRTAVILSGAYDNIREVSIGGNSFFAQDKFGVQVVQSGLVTINGNLFRATKGCSISADNASDGEMVSASDNTFEYCAGDKADSGLSVSAVIYMSATGSNDTLSRIIGNTFYACGNSQAASSETHYIICSVTSAVVKGNIFHDVRGNSANTDRLRMIRVGAASVVSENLFDIDLSFTFVDMPQKLHCIQVESTAIGAVVMGNMFNLHGTPGGTFAEVYEISCDATELRAIGNSNLVALPASATAKWFILTTAADAVLLGNHSPGGASVLSITSPSHPSPSVYNAEGVRVVFNDMNGF